MIDKDDLAAIRSLFSGVARAPAVSDLQMEVEQLRKKLEKAEMQTDTLLSERAAIVAYLRERANAPHPTEAGERLLSPAGRGLLLLMADRIERGEHLKGENR
jgi:hypothetical protein